MDDFIKDSFSWLLSVLIGLGAWIGRGMRNDIEGLKRESGDCKLNLANFRAHVSENHPTKNDLNAARIETKESVERVHQRLDGMAEDIKTLLSRTGGQ